MPMILHDKSLTHPPGSDCFQECCVNMAQLLQRTLQCRRIVATQSLAQLGSSHALSHGVVCRVSKWFHKLKRACWRGDDHPPRW